METVFVYWHQVLDVFYIFRRIHDCFLNFLVLPYKSHVKKRDKKNFKAAELGPYGIKFYSLIRPENRSAPILSILKILKKIRFG
jgi:hypothetical protein